MSILNDSGTLVSRADTHAATPLVNSNQIVALDVVRALAALIVFLGHVRIVCFTPWESLATEYKTLGATLFYAVARFGQEAVLVFFVLSGFFVGGQLVTRLRAQRFNVSDYAIDRATRLLVPLAPACALTLFVGWVTTGDLADAPNILGAAFGLNGILVETSAYNLPLWSIAFEIWFYIAAGAFAALLNDRASPVAFALTLASVIVFSVLNVAFFAFWLAGASIFVWRERLRHPAILVAGAVLVLMSSVLFEIHDAGPAVMARDKAIYWQALICLGFALMIPCLAGARVNAVLQPVARVSAFMAASSYSLYVFHYPLLMLISLYVPQVKTFGPAAVAQFALISFATFGLCWSLWFVFERQTDPVRRWAKRAIANLSTSPVAARSTPA
tara:strand:+ start:227 stop:1387 length:1161 start_codon:yes stop_codon:yes gene_type:complete